MFFLRFENRKAKYKNLLRKKKKEEKEMKGNKIN